MLNKKIKFSSMFFLSLFFSGSTFSSDSVALNGDGSYSYDGKACYKIIPGKIRKKCPGIQEICIGFRHPDTVVVVSDSDKICVEMKRAWGQNSPGNTGGPNPANPSPGPNRPSGPEFSGSGMTEGQKDILRGIGNTIGQLLRDGSLLPDYGEQYRAANIPVPSYYLKAVETLDHNIQEQKARLQANENVQRDILNKMSDKLNNYKEQGYQIPRPANVSQKDVENKIAPILNSMVRQDYNGLVEEVSKLQKGYLNKAEYYGQQGLAKIAYYNNAVGGILTPDRLLKLPYTIPKKIDLLTQPGAKEGINVREKINRLTALESTINNMVHSECSGKKCEGLLNATSKLQSRIQDLLSVYVLADSMIDRGYPDSTVEAGQTVLDNSDAIIKRILDKIDSSDENLESIINDVLYDINKGFNQTVEDINNISSPDINPKPVEYYPASIKEISISPEIDNTREEIRKSVNESISCSFLGPQCKLSLDISKIINEILPEFVKQLRQKAKDLAAQIAANPGDIVEILKKQKEETEKLIKTTLENEVIIRFQQQLKELKNFASSLNKDNLDELVSNELIENMLYLANEGNSSVAIGPYSERFIEIARSVYRVSVKKSVTNELDENIYLLLKHQDFKTQVVVDTEKEIHSVLYLVNYVGNGVINDVVINNTLIFLRGTFENKLFKNFDENEVASIKKGFAITADLIESNRKIKTEAKDMLNLVKEQIAFIKTIYGDDFSKFSLKDFKKMKLVASTSSATFKKLKVLYENGTAKSIFKSNGELSEEVRSKGIAVRVISDGTILDGKVVVGNWTQMEFELAISETQKLKINFLMNKENNKVYYEAGYKADILAL